jgi:hypothetical protein
MPVRSMPARYRFSNQAAFSPDFQSLYVRLVAAIIAAREKKPEKEK